MKEIREQREFLATLGHYQRAWKWGLTAALLVRAAGWAIMAATVYFIADYALALDETVRWWLNSLLPLMVAGVLTPEALRVIRLGMKETAARVDAVGRHRRKDVLTAWELHRAAEDAADGLTAYLARRSIGEALARMAVLKQSVMRPREVLTRRIRGVGIGAAVAAAVAILAGGEAIRVIVPRLIRPSLDTPPYSRYRFAVTPERPSILYGGSAEVSVTVTGAPVNSPVWLVTRRPGGGASRAACFQEGGDRYAQRLENVTAPVEFCFAVGRARSRWHTVELQLQPQIILARVRLAPPPYTRLPPREFAAGQEDVAGVRGTAVTLTLTSNRPLKDGSLTVGGRTVAPSGARVVAARLESERSAVFEWVLTEEAEVKAVLRDVRGTPTAEPLVLHQKLTPDEPPSTALSEPPEFSMATPGAVIRVAGSVDDDFGIEQVDWIRTVVGFNDRGMTVRRGAVGTRCEFETEIDLRRLGVDAGQELEFYAEALDNNPYCPGSGVSPIARVKIITEEEYAEVIRNREVLEQFTLRYEVAAAALKRVMETLEELQGLTLWRNPDRAKLAETVKKVLDAHVEAERVFKQMAADFAAYDVEKALKENAGEIVSKLAENRKELEGMREPGPENTAKAEGMLKRLGAEAASLTQQRVDAELAAKVAKVMDGAARFQRVIQRQESLVRLLRQRYASAVSPADLPFLPGYGEMQTEIARELAGMVADTRAAARALPSGMAQFGSDALAFVQLLEETGASNHMANAGTAARNTDALRTCREAQLALERLMSLIQSGCCSGNSFGGLCKGQQPAFGPDGIRKTLQQMFRSLCRKRGVGQGSGSGLGGEGEGGEGAGAGAEGFSELGTPVYGPSRGAVGVAASVPGTAGAGRGGGAGSGGRTGAAVVERASGAGSSAPAGEAVQLERLPAKYREAVKRYFRNGGEGERP